jgi:hypothetical protein
MPTLWLPPVASNPAHHACLCNPQRSSAITVAIHASAPPVATTFPSLLQTGVIANARNPAHDAWLYNPKAAAGSRFTTLAATNINRYYHSTALLLPDASVLVMGSEYGEQ